MHNPYSALPEIESRLQEMETKYINRTAELEQSIKNLREQVIAFKISSLLPRWVTVEEFSKMLNCSPSTVYRMQDRGEIVFQQGIGSIARIDLRQFAFPDAELPTRKQRKKAEPALDSGTENEMFAAVMAALN